MLPLFSDAVELSLEVRTATDADLAAIETLKGTQHSTINSNEIRGPGLKHLAGLKKLRQLHLSGERIDNDTLKFVAGLPSLECLELGLCKVTGRRLGDLGHLRTSSRCTWRFRPRAESPRKAWPRLRDCKALERIDATTEITNKGLDDLSRITSLKMLYLCASRCRVTNAGVGCLRGCKTSNTWAFAR